jgi:hypothetical protein
LLATHRVSDASGSGAPRPGADPRFASAYLEFEALLAAEFEVTDDRQRRFDTPAAGELLVERHWRSIPSTARRTCRAHPLRTRTWPPPSATSPRSRVDSQPAEGHAGLAEVLYASLPRRGEVEPRSRPQARSAEPAYDVRMAVLTTSAATRGGARVTVDVGPPSALCAGRRPLCESNLLVGDIAEAVRRCEEALALDPLLVESRRFLIHQYLLLGEPVAAESLVESPGGEPSLRALPILIDRQDWRRAGEVAYRALERQTTSPTALAYACSAIRMHARVTGDYAAAASSRVGHHADVERQPGDPGTAYRVRDPRLRSRTQIQAGQEQRGRRLAAIPPACAKETGELGARILVRPLHPAGHERRTRRRDRDV